MDSLRPGSRTIRENKKSRLRLATWSAPAAPETCAIESEGMKYYYPSSRTLPKSIWAPSWVHLKLKWLILMDFHWNPHWWDNRKSIGFQWKSDTLISNVSISELKWSHMMFLGANNSISDLLNRLRTFLGPQEHSRYICTRTPFIFPYFPLSPPDLMISSELSDISSRFCPELDVGRVNRLFQKIISSQ